MLLIIFNFNLEVAVEVWRCWYQANCIKNKLADASLSLSTLGFQVSSTCKSAWQQLKPDTQAFKTQADSAETAKTQTEGEKKTAAEQYHKQG